MLNHVTLAVVAHTQKVTFHRTRNKCKREYVLLEVALHAVVIRKIRFGLPKSGNTKVYHANGSSTCSCGSHNGLGAV